MKHNVDTNLVLIDLDVLLDTRVGCIMQHNLELGSQLVNNPAYYDRNDDHFERIVPGIDLAQYQEWYKNRSTETLKFSKPTNAVFNLTSLIGGMLVDLHSPSTLTREAGIIVNLHPYDLTLDEKHLIHQALVSYFGVEIRIRFIERFKSQISFAWLDHNHIHTYVLYDLYEWSQHQLGHINNINDYPKFPHINIIAPQLATDIKILEKLYEEYPELTEDDNLFDIVCQDRAPFFRLSLIHPEQMSYVKLKKEA